MAGNFAFGEEFGIGVSLNELKFKWGNAAGTECTLGPWGGVCLEIPRIDIAVDKTAVKLKGSLEWREGAGGARDFRGAVQADFPSLKFSAAATLIIGQKKLQGTDCHYWYFDAQVQFPSGIPIATNLAIYGFMGGMGQNVRSDPVIEKGLIKSVKIVPPEERSPPEKSDTCEGLTFKAGLTLGTAVDNGYTINADVMLLIETSGPVISLEGRGWLLQERTGRAGKDSNVYALIRYDGHEDLFLMQVTGDYKLPPEGLTVVSLGGGFEILASHPEWHVYLGWKGYQCAGPPARDRAAQKLRIDLLGLFRADAYFMIGSLIPFPVASGADCRPGIMLGAGFDYSKEIDAAIVTVYLKSWGSGDVALSWSPVQVYVAFALGGKCGFTLFGIDFGRGFDASVEGQYPNPAELKAAVSFSLPLPWPLPDIRISFTIYLQKKKLGEVPPFEHPLRSTEVVFPQGNLPAAVHGAELTCSGPKVDPASAAAPPCNSDVLGIPPDQDGTGMAPPEKITQLNPRFVLTFRRPVTGRNPADPAHVQYDDVQPSDGWSPATPDKFAADQDGQFRVWYRLRSVTLREVEPPLEMMDCVSRSGVELAGLPTHPAKTVGFWGTAWDADPAKAWQKEQAVMAQPPSVGKKELGANPGTVDQRRRQIFTWHVGALPGAGSQWPDDLWNREGPMIEGTPVALKPNTTIEDPPKALKPNTYYQIRVVGRYDWDRPNANQTCRTGGARDLLDVTAENMVYCFRTGPVPADLTPYVAWTWPKPGVANAFTGQPLQVLFNTAGMDAVYGGRMPEMVVYDADGHVIGRGQPALEGQLLALVGTGLAPRERYFVRLLDPGGHPVYGFDFVTSRFESLGALLDDPGTRLGGPKIVSGRPLATYTLPLQPPDDEYVVLQTPEPLPWALGQLLVALRDVTANQYIPLRRLTPDHETAQVLARADGKPLAAGSYELLIAGVDGLPGLGDGPAPAVAPDALKARVPSLEFYRDADLAALAGSPTIKSMSFTRNP